GGPAAQRGGGGAVPRPAGADDAGRGPDRDPLRLCAGAGEVLAGGRLPHPRGDRAGDRNSGRGRRGGAGGGGDGGNERADRALGQGASRPVAVASPSLGQVLIGSVVSASGRAPSSASR